MLSYTCEQAKRAKRLSRFIVSTDDDRIAECGRRYGAEVPFLRPKELAQDETPMLDVLRNLLATLKQRETVQPEVLVLLQPTSPLRPAERIDAAVELLEKSGADSVVSVVPVPHQFSPSSLMEIKDGSLVPIAAGPQVLRRQDKPVFYRRNGPAVLAVRRKTLEANSLYGSRCVPLIMSEEESVDIDTPFDLTLAELLMSKR